MPIRLPCSPSPPDALLPIALAARPPALSPSLQAFVDERDAGVIYVTHFTLLLGLALPVWTTLALPGSSSFLAAQQAALAGGGRVQGVVQGMAAGVGGLASPTLA